MNAISISMMPITEVYLNFSDRRASAKVISKIPASTLIVGFSGR